MSNLEEIWSDDLLRRRGEADMLERFLLSRATALKEQGSNKSYVLNIDAGFGRGKSHFLQRLGQQLEFNGYRVATVDAWANDFAQDPLIPVVSAIAQAFPKGRGRKSAKDVVAVGGKLAAILTKHAGHALLNKLLGEDGGKLAAEVGEGFANAGMEAAADIVDSASDALGKRLVAQFEEGRSTLDTFRKTLIKHFETSGDDRPLFILVDELDRCRPTFAIEMLERIKHLFDVPNAIFVIATDTDQLRHSVGVVYGSGFDGRGYLLRFFDRTYKLEKPC